MRRRSTFSRADRLGHLLHDEVIRLVGGEIRSPLAAHVLVTATRLSPDLGHLRVCYVMEGSDEPNERAHRMLEGAGGFIARALRHSLQLKRTPRVVFTFDGEYVRMRRVRELLAREAETDDAGPSPLTAGAANDAEDAGRGGEAERGGGAERGGDAGAEP